MDATISTHSKVKNNSYECLQRETYEAGALGTFHFRRRNGKTVYVVREVGAIGCSRGRGRNETISLATQSIFPLRIPLSGVRNAVTPTPKQIPKSGRPPGEWDATDHRHISALPVSMQKKTEETYSVIMSWVRHRLNFALLRSSIVRLLGSCSLRSSADLTAPATLVVAEAAIPQG